jgi:Fungal trichothecene efflux pump (TRI12)
MYCLTTDIASAAFSGALAVVTPDTPRTAVGLGTMAGFGVGGVLVPAATVAITVTQDTTIATCVALSLCIRTVGGSIGYAIYYNVFINRLKPKLPLYIGQYAVQAGLPVKSAEAFVLTYLTAPANITSIPGVTPAVIHGAEVGTRWAYAESLKYVWYTSIPFGVLAIIASCFIGNITKYMTNRIAATIRHH